MSDITPEFIVHMIFYSVYYGIVGSLLTTISYLLIANGAALLGVDILNITEMQIFAGLGFIFGVIAYLIMEFRPCPRRIA